jgi:hypothetical protein
MRHSAFWIQITVENIQRMVIGCDHPVAHNTDAPAATDISTRIGIVVKRRFNGNIGNFADDGLAVPIQFKQAATILNGCCPDYGSKIYIHRVRLSCYVCCGSGDLDH